MIVICYFIFLTTGQNVINAEITDSESVRLPKSHICKSDCRQDSCALDCDDFNLNLIPTCHMISISCNVVTKLTLRNNKIRHIPPAGFAHFTNLQILDLSDNPLEECTNSSFVGLKTLSKLIIVNVHPHTAFIIFENGAFLPLTLLRLLNLEYSWINLRSLFRSFCSLTENIESIKLDGMYNFHRLITFDGTWFQCFAHLKLKWLSINHSNVQKITFEALLKLRHLHYLSLNSNKLNGDIDFFMGFAAMPNLTYLDISFQSARFFKDNYSWLNWLPERPKMFKEINTITTRFIDSNTMNMNTTSMGHIYMFSNLQTLLVQNMYVSSEFQPIICWINCRLLNVDFSFVTQINIVGMIPCMQHLKYLNLRGIKTLVFDVEAFHDMPSLEVLMLGSAKHTR